jgi:hypothetical protein
VKDARIVPSALGNERIGSTPIRVLDGVVISISRAVQIKVSYLVS